MPREEWAEIRERLIKDPTNKETLEAISTGFNFVALETESPPIEVRERERERIHYNIKDDVEALQYCHGVILYLGPDC